MRFGTWVAYLVFIELTILVGIPYFGVLTLSPSVTVRPVTSLGAGVVLFFWSMIYGTVVFGVHIAT